MQPAYDAHMLLPRIGSLIVLGGFAYGLAIYGRMAYVTGVEGFWSWAWMLLFLAPSTLLGIAGAVLVLRQHRFGRMLTTPFMAVTVVTGLLAVANVPPVGGFLDDYQEAALERGVEVPPFEASQGLTEVEYAEKLAGDFKLQGALIAIGAAVAFYVMVRRGAIFTRRARPAASPPGSTVRSGR